MTLPRRSFLLFAGAEAVVAGCAPVRIPDFSEDNILSENLTVPEYPQDMAVDPLPQDPVCKAVDPQQIQMRRMHYLGAEQEGTVIVNPNTFKLYHIGYDGYATEYPIAIGRDGVNAPSGQLYIARKAKNPKWTPTESMRKRTPSLPEFVAGGSPANPLGSHAIYFFDANTGLDTLVRAHGTKAADRKTIGTRASSGCYRMLNEHAEHLYEMVRIPAGDIHDPSCKPRLKIQSYGDLVSGMDYQNALIMNDGDIRSAIAAERALSRPRWTPACFRPV